MGIRADHLRLYVIRPTLTHIGLWSEAAENLLLGTAAVESDMGWLLVQESGPARGIYQVEPATMDDVLLRAQKRHLHVYLRVMDYVNPGFPYESQLIWNLGFSTSIARLKYFLFPAPLPQAEDIDGLARYWKDCYNTSQGKGTLDKFKVAYRRKVGA